MRAIIGGAGEVGRGVARALRAENRSVALIDSNPKALKVAQSLDCLLVGGDLLSRSTLEKAGLDDCDLVIMATNSDERNILGCSLARDHLLQMDPVSADSLVSVARVHHPALLDEEGGRLKRWTSVNHAACAIDQVVEQLAARLQSPSLEDTLPLGNNAWVALARVQSGGLLDGRTVGESIEGIDGLPRPFGVQRANKKAVMIDDSTVLQEEDLVIFATSGEHTFHRIAKAAGFEETRLPDNPRVLIFGATRVGHRLASHFLSVGSAVTVVEPRLDVANELLGSKIGTNKRLDVVHGEPQDEELLRDIEVKEHHIAISVLEDDHANIAITIRAQDHGIKRTGLVVEDDSLVDSVRRIGLTCAVSQRRVSINAIMTYIHSRVPGRFQMIPSAREFISMTAEMTPGHSRIGQSVAKLEKSFGGGARIALIERHPKGSKLKVFDAESDFVLKENDRLVMFATKNGLPKVEAALER
jgi:trk system potassium uptake protein TrkA